MHRVQKGATLVGTLNQGQRKKTVKIPRKSHNHLREREIYEDRREREKFREGRQTRQGGKPEKKGGFIFQTEEGGAIGQEAGTISMKKLKEGVWEGKKGKHHSQKHLQLAGKKDYVSQTRFLTTRKREKWGKIAEKRPGERS